jgi:alpha-glucosidase
LPATWSELTVENQSSNSDSSLSLYKRALSERAKLLAGAQDLTWDTNRIERGVLGFSRGGIQVYLNTGDKPVRLKATELILASGGVPECENGELELKSRRAVWFKLKDF